MSSLGACKLTSPPTARTVRCNAACASPAAAVIEGDATFPVNQGARCIKGWTAAAILTHPQRLLSPLVRDGQGALVAATWDEALGRIAQGIRATQARYGLDAASELLKKGTMST